MSRTINRECFFGAKEKAKLQALSRQAAEYCGLELWTHALMANHPHCLVHTPFWEKDPDDAELLRRYRILNPDPRGVKYRSMNLDVVAAHLAADTPTGIDWRRRQLAQMGSFSQFMKIVKQRFVAWYNKLHCRTGTVWAGTFKSVLVEANSGALLAMAAYIDLNPVRAGLVADPKDYPFCGYAAAVAGDAKAREGIKKLTELPTWDLAQAAYRRLLYGVGIKAKGAKRTISIEDFQKVVAVDGKISVAEALRCRIRRFTDSLVLGAAEFVAQQLEIFLKVNKRKRVSRPVPLPPITDWGGLTTLRSLRRR